ncbi:MAG: class I SAM-dependent methyltransferase [Thermoleophilaceae bacterium]
MPGAYTHARQGLRTRLAEVVSRRARAARRQLFERLMQPGPDDPIVDVGCGQAGLAAFAPDLAITGVDREPRPGYAAGRHRFLQGDATALPFADAEFEIAYSNSVVEHIVDPGARQQFADEVRRVARRYFVQTPDRWFPVEPHSLLPLVHWLPRRLGRRLWRLGVSGDPFDETLLLGPRELRALFPDARIVRERLGPLTKSLVAVGPAPGRPGVRGGPGA